MAAGGALARRPCRDAVPDSGTRAAVVASITAFLDSIGFLVLAKADAAAILRRGGDGPQQSPTPLEALAPVPASTRSPLSPPSTVLTRSLRHPSPLPEFNVRPVPVPVPMYARWLCYGCPSEVVSVLLNLMELDAADFESNDMQETGSLAVNHSSDIQLANSDIKTTKTDA